MTSEIRDLTGDDLDTLCEALEAWEQKDLAGDMMGDIVESLFSKDGRPDPLLAEKRRAAQLKRDADKKLRKERSVLLRAKLITLRDGRMGNRLVADALDAHLNH